MASQKRTLRFGDRVPAKLAAIFFVCAGIMSWQASTLLAQFNTPTIDGLISAGEYGTHTDGSNQQTNGGTVWYMTWDAANLYVGISGANVNEAAVIYVDGNPIAPINGGTNADGTLVGQNYDGTSFAALQFRADYVSYFKEGYQEYRTADGSNSWSGANSPSGSFFSNLSNVREYAIPWSNITGSGLPSAFNWFGYVTSNLGTSPPGGFVYGEMPVENGEGFIGTSAREQRYFTVSNTANGGSTKPFSRNSYVFNSASDISGFGAISVFDFTMNSSGQQIFRSTDGSTWTIGGNLRVDAGTIHFDNTTGAATVSGNVVISSGGTLNLGNVIGGDINVAGNWTNNGTFNHNSRTVTFNGTGTQTISGSSTTNFGFLTINVGSSTDIVEALSAITTTSGNLTLTQGTLKISSASTFTPFSGSETIPAAAGFHLNHASAVSNWGSTGSLDLDGKLIIDNGTLTIGSSSGNELTMNAATTEATINNGTLNLAGRVRVVSSGTGSGLTINGGEVVVTKVGNSSSADPNFNLGATGKFTMTGGTVTFERANGNAGGGELVITSGSGAKSITGGTFRIGNAATPAAQIIEVNSAIPIFHFTVNSANATAQLANALDVNGDLTINAGAFDANNLNLNLAGNWSNNGTFTPGTGTVTMDGANPQTMSGSTFNNLTINNASGVNLLTDETVNNTLTLLNGNVTTGTNKMIIAAGGVVARTSGHVAGNLQKHFAVASTQTFEVGTGSDYTPVDVAIASVSSAGNVTAKSTAGDHSNISSSTLDASKSVNRNWTLASDASLSFTTYDATFNFVSGDLDGGTNTSNLSIGKFNSPNWSYPTVGTRTATSTQATGMTSFSDFQLAEPLPGQMTYTVTNTNDTGAGSLRQAIIDANAHANLDASTPDLIHFNITSGTGPFTIAPLSALPTITDPVIIDGLTQAGASCSSWPPTLKIELNGASAGSGVNGLTITAGNSTVRGLVINRFSSDGIEMSSNGGNRIECNLIGTDVNGTTDLGNLSNGVLVSSVASNTIGGTASGTRNLISGNNGDGVELNGAGATSNLVQGNYIGTNISGTLSLGNAGHGVLLLSGAANNTIGGASAGAGNVLSGNVLAGVRFENGATTGNFVQGNLIGTNAAGTAALGNGGGVGIVGGAANNTIGGTVAGARNVISGNATLGVLIQDSGSNGNVVQGNLIGTNAAGTGAIGNSQHGVLIYYFASNNTIGGTASGAGNTIAFNNFDGVAIITTGGPTSPTNNAVQGNSIFSNTGLGLDLENNGVTANDLGDGDTGANNLQNFPVLNCAHPSGGNTEVKGSLNSTANTTFTLEFFSNAAADPSGFGEGETFQLSTTVTTDGTGNVNFTASLPTALALGQFVSATATDPSNNTSEFSKSIAVTNELLANAGMDAEICAGGSTAIGGSPAATGGATPYMYSWSPTTGLNDASLPNPTASPATTTTYTLTVTDANGCTATDQVTVTVNPLPIATVSGDATICAGGSTTISAALTGTAPWNLTWSDGFVQNGVASSPATRSVSPAATTVYTVTSVSDANCTGTSSGNATVTVNPLPTATVSGDATICAGASTMISATLTGTGPWNLTWSDGFVQNGVASSPATRSVSPAATTTYTVTSVSDANCTGTSSGSATVTVNPLPTVSISGNDPVVTGTTHTYTANTNASSPSYSWSVTGGTINGSNTNSTVSVTAGAVGTMVVNVSVTDGSTTCSNNATKNVTVNANTLAANAGNDDTVCLGGAANLDGTATGGSGTYTFAWTVQSGPNTSGAQFNDATLEDPVFTPTLAGVYVLRFTVDDGVVAPVFDEVQITVNALPTATVSGDATICAGASTTISATLTGTGPWNLTWSDGFVQNGVASSPATRSVSPAATTVYTVTSVSDANCTGTSSGNATVTVNPLPTVTFNAVSAVCLNAPAIDLTSYVSPAGGTFSGNGVTAAGIFTPSSAGAGTHTITYSFTDGNNCSNSASQNIVVNPLPTVTFNPVGPFLVTDAPVDLSPAVSPAGGTFSGPGISGTMFDPSVAGVGTHTVTYSFTDGNSCTNSASQNITVNAPPVKAFVFLANKITLKRTKQHTPAGDMHSNGALTIEKGDPSTYNSNLTAVGKITIQKDNTVNGDVTSQTSISNSGTINGTPSVEPVDTEALPSLNYTSGGDNKTVPSGGSLSLAPGSYGIVTVNSGGTLKLSSGEYFMKELRALSSETVIEIDLTSGDEVIINVESNLQLGKEAAIQLLPNGESDSKLVTFNTLQSSAVNFGKEAYLLGSFNAPNAKVTLVKNSQLRGSICAKEILVERDCLFLHHSSPGSLPGPGNLPKSSFVDEEADSYQLTATSYALEQNYPNPFNPSTTIAFALPQASEVTLSIFNTNGQLVKKLVAGEMNAGQHNLTWDATNERGERVASGVYLYVIKAGEFTAQRKLVLMK